jgi:hypothetical protein
MAQGSAESVESPNDECVTRAKLVEDLGEFFAVVESS